MGDGLFECILGRWSDLRAGADFDGKDEADAGADYGAFGLLGRSAERTWLVSALCRFCRGSVYLWENRLMKNIAGAGASVPLLGFGHTLMKGVKEAVEQDGFLGLFTGGFQAGAAGTAAALIFGYLASLVFKPKMKK